MHYQQFAVHAYCGAAGPVSKMASQQEKAFCVLRFEVSRSVIAVQREFQARSKKITILVYSSFLPSHSVREMIMQTSVKIPREIRNAK
jgi:hypothetical protein